MTNTDSSESTQQTKERRERQTKSDIQWAQVLAVTTTGTPLLLIWLPLISTAESMDSWVHWAQLSGFCMLPQSALMIRKVVSAHRQLSLPGLTYVGFEKFKEKQLKKLTRLDATAFVLALTSSTLAGSKVLF